MGNVRPEEYDEQELMLKLIQKQIQLTMNVQYDLKDIRRIVNGILHEIDTRNTRSNIVDESKAVNIKKSSKGNCRGA